MSFEIQTNWIGTNNRFEAFSPIEAFITHEPVTLGAENNSWFWRVKCLFFPTRLGFNLSPSNGVSRSCGRTIISTADKAAGVIFDETGFYTFFGFLSLKSMVTVEYNPVSIRFKGPENEISGSYVCPFDGNSHNYYHWLIEGLVALCMMRRAGLSAPAIVFSAERVTSWQLESLSLLGEETCFFVESLDRETVSVSDVAWIEHRYLDKISPSDLSALSSVLKGRVGCGEKYAKFVYIRRRQGLSRSVENNSEVEQLLTKRGFTSVDLDGMSVRDQISLFSGAALVVGAHGAGLANLIFMEKGATLLEILPDGHEVRNLFWLLACKVNVKYAFIRAHVQNLYDPYSCTLRVPLQDLENMISFVENGVA